MGFFDLCVGVVVKGVFVFFGEEQFGCQVVYDWVMVVDVFWWCSQQFQYIGVVFGQEFYEMAEFVVDCIICIVCYLWGVVKVVEFWLWEDENVLDVGIGSG